MPVGDTGIRTGEVWLDDYDRAVKVFLGGVERLVAREGKTQEPYYTLSIPKVKGSDEFQGHIPILFGDASSVVSPIALPAIVITKDDDFDTDGQRRVGFGTAYRVPTDAARTAGAVTATDPDLTTGYTHYETQSIPEPVTLRYTVFARARTSAEASAMGRWLWKRIWHFNSLLVKDSTGAERRYSVACEGKTRSADISEIVAQRTTYTFRLAIAGELEYAEPHTAKAVRNTGVTAGGL